jgi:3-dehydroquinate dehydratase II
MQGLQNMQGTILCFNGPNLNMLGLRDPLQYGSVTLTEIENHLKSELSETLRSKNISEKIDLKFFQSNHEGQLIDTLQAEILSHANQKQHVHGLILNAGGLSHTSVALADTVEVYDQMGVHVYEVHLSQIFRREDFRHRSLISRHARAVIAGLGGAGYGVALNQILSLVAAKTNAGS